MTLRLIHLGIMATLALLPFWVRWQGAPRSFSADYVLGFVVVVPMLATIGLWLLAGAPQRARLWRDGWRLAWVACWLALVVWAWLSQYWAYKGGVRDGMAQNGALTLAMVGAFTFVVACCPPPTRWLLRLLIAQGAVLCAIGGAQVALQSDMGLRLFGEFALDPARSGVSVVMSEGVRWLRPYGFSPHPNIFAGALLACLLALSPALLRGRWWALGAWGVGVWVFLLTFSRGAWLAYGVAFGALWAWAWLSRRADWRVLVRPLLLGVFLAGAFFVLYRPFVLARAGVGVENTELRSVGDRVILTEIALEAIARYPLQGVGAGNFPFYAHDFIRTRTPYAMQGDNVHHVGLLVLSELGVIGLGLLVGMGLVGVGGALAQKPLDETRASFLAIVGAYVVVGFFDHYPYTLLGSLTLWQALLAMGFVENDIPHTPFKRGQ
jgi:O-antigen ligase